MPEYWEQRAVGLMGERATLLQQVARLKAGNCLKCNMGPLRESCAYPEACEHPGRELALRLNAALLTFIESV